MKQQFIDDVYGSLQGLLLAPTAGVENVFAQGSVCDTCYREMLGAYARLCDRLGVTEEDEDVEIILNSMQTITDILCYKMYEYGAKFSAKG